MLLFAIMTARLLAVEIKIQEGVSFPNGMAEKILSSAKRQHSGDPKSLEIFKLSTGKDYAVGFVVFKQEIKGREAKTVTYQAWFHISDGVI